MPEMKKCTKCGESKPSTVEYFNKRKDTKSGLRAECKICLRKHKAKYAYENKEKIQSRGRDYYERNSEKIRAKVNKLTVFIMPRKEVHKWPKKTGKTGGQRILRKQKIPNQRYANRKCQEV